MNLVQILIIAVTSIYSFNSAAALEIESFTTESFYQTYDRTTDTCSRFFDETIGNIPSPDKLGKIIGAKPIGKERLPLYIYLPGSFQPVDTEISRLHVERMARLGYFAVAIRYPNANYPLSCEHDSNKPELESFDDKARCLFSNEREDSAVSKLCALGEVDCEKDLVVHGFSQGAQLAAMAKRYNKKFRKALLYGAGNYNLFTKVKYPCVEQAEDSFAPYEIRSLVGDQDIFFGGANIITTAGNIHRIDRIITNGLVKQQRALTAKTTCGRLQGNCLNVDGSGYYIVRGYETENNCSSHGFFTINTNSPTPCEGLYIRPDRSYLSKQGSLSERVYPWSLDQSFHWLTQRNVR